MSVYWNEVLQWIILNLTVGSRPVAKGGEERGIPPKFRGKMKIELQITKQSIYSRSQTHSLVDLHHDRSKNKNQ